MPATPLPLPVADVIKTASVHDWLTRLAECVRAADYAGARPFWHSDIVVFGTYQELVRGLTAWTETQWDYGWPKTDGFAFDLEHAAVLAGADGTMATAITPWTSTGFYPDGTRFERPGRATIVLVGRGLDTPENRPQSRSYTPSADCRPPPRIRISVG